MSRTVNALFPWMGSNRTNAQRPAELLGDVEHLTIPFTGGFSEVPWFKARTIVCNDRHGYVMLTAEVAAHPALGPRLYRRLRRQPFHPYVFEVAQRFCATYDPNDYYHAWDDEKKLNYAEAYFTAVWMGRSAKAGTDDEFKGNLSTRMNAGGGDSAVRFRSAVRSLVYWRRALARCSFDCRDAFERLAKVQDRPRHGIYCDPPWPGVGEDYRHKFSEADHRRLADRLAEFREARVVVRYGEHPLIVELYPTDRWAWHRLTGRDQANQEKAEVLIVNRCGDRA